MRSDRDALEDFDEAWYLAAYPDIAAAVAAGQLSSGRFHFEHFGRAEGRRGNAAASNDGARMLMDPFSTHQALLVAAMLCTDGPIVEMGGGYYSTPLISAFCNAQRREAHTIETFGPAYELLMRFSSSYHKLWRMDGYDFASDGRNTQFLPRADMTRAQYIEIQSRFLADFCAKIPPLLSVVFIDQTPGIIRAAAIDHFAGLAEFIVVHDTEEPAYGYEPILSKFRYRWDFRLHTPQSTVVSNFRPCDCFASLLGQNYRDAADMDSYLRRQRIRR